ncbi:MAG: flagellar assembly protein FliW [Deltaproteobacteria bacterium]|jgi:flagellar assembly factor FliW|nr:flagellar assembly protein FliW [Deltaproteobacteria bacterium]
MAEKNMMEFQTRLGPQKVSLDRIIRFPKGLIGYEGRRDFALLQIRDGVPFLILQSLEDPSLGLMVADPYSFITNFSVRLNDTEQAMLSVDRPEQVSVLVTVSIPAGKPEDTTLNLTGPIIINHEARIGLQVAQSDPQQPGKVFLRKGQEVKKEAGPGE